MFYDSISNLEPLVIRKQTSWQHKSTVTFSKYRQYIYSTTTIRGYARRRDLYKSLNSSALWKRESRSSVKQISGVLKWEGGAAPVPNKGKTI